jgi:hypothetical protein
MKRNKNRRKRKKMTTNRKKFLTKKVIFQHIFEASKTTEDEFWRDVLIKMSYGKVPKNFTVNQNSLIFRKGSHKEKKITFTEKTPPKDIARLCIHFMKDCSGMRSKKDLENESSLSKENNNIVCISKTPWKTIKKNKRLQEILIFEFIENEAKKRNLNNAEKSQLKGIVNMGILLDVFTGMKFDDKEKVSWIEGLIYDESKREYTIETKTEQKRSQDNGSIILEPNFTFLEVKRPNLYYEWMKFTNKQESKESTSSNFA